MILRLLPALPLVALLTIAGCASLATPMAPAHEASRTQIAAEALASSGEVRVSVRWPSRVQLLPDSAETLTLTLSAQGAPVASASLTRPASTARFERLPVGDYLLSAQARRADSGRTLAAEGAAWVTVLASRVAQARLVLTPVAAPRLDALIPSWGRAPIELHGANLRPPSGGTWAILVDGRPVPAALAQPGDTRAVLAALPSWAGATCSISLLVDGMPATARVFTRLDHFTLSPASASMPPGASLPLVATAFADAEETATVSVPLVWAFEDAIPDPGNFTLTSDGVLTSGNATGSVTVRAALGQVLATASVTVE